MSRAVEEAPRAGLIVLADCLLVVIMAVAAIACRCAGGPFDRSRGDPGPRLRSVWRVLADHDACGRGAGGQRERGGAQFGQVAAVDGERAHLADPAFVYVQEPAIGAEPGIDRVDAAGGGAPQSDPVVMRAPAVVSDAI